MAVLVVLIVFQVLLFYAVVRDPFDDKPFDRDTWLRAATATSGPNPRGPMAEDLRRRFLRAGMSRKAVNSLLGKPDGGWDDKQKLHEDHYNLGQWSILSIEPDYLVIHYDKDDRIDRTVIPAH